jgi:signal transduction histidine kinase/CheY-like chemotaxis protein
MVRPLPGPQNYFEAFIKAAQYLAGLTAQQDIGSETGKVLVSFFGAEAGAVEECPASGEAAGCRWAFSERYSGRRDLEAEIREAIAEVRESGFLSERIISAPPLSSACFPITRENQVVGVMVACHGLPGPLPRELLNVYLAVAGLVGATSQRLASERELRRHRRQLEEEIAERIQAQAALRQANDRLIESDRRKDEFLAILSHELRNPLSPVRSSVYVLEHAAPGGEQAKRALRIIDRQAGHMARLVEDLLDVTRIARGKINLQREQVDINALARWVAEDHRAAFSRNGVELQVKEAGDFLWVYADPTRLAQVIGNLLSNSAKFTARGGWTVLSVEPNERGEVTIRVRDNGAGISPECMPRLFEPFVQASQTIERSRGGLGLGLTLVKGLVEMHGGSVAVRSEGEGKGSEFTIVLPLHSSRQRTAAASPAPTCRPSMRRVLVVEDNVDAAESLREALELGEHEVAIAYSGPEGVEAARRYHPDVVLCDIGLPGMDGYGVAEALRSDSNDALRSTFLVALSGYSLQEDIKRSMEAGFDRHMAKPPSIEALEELLAKAPAGGAAR